jgi:AraC-like DNA-binding protein
MEILDYTILIGSIIGIVNSLLLIIYSLTTSKGNKLTNYLFALLVFTLTLRVSKSIIITFSTDSHDFLLTIGLSGFLAIGPAFYLYTKSIVSKPNKLSVTALFHLLPAIIFTFMWVNLDFIRTNADVWHIFYRAILLQYMIYMVLSANSIMPLKTSHPKIYKNLSIIGWFLLLIWFSYALNEAAGFPYISGAILYSLLIYFSVIILINRGYLIDFSAPKYAKSGIDENTSSDLAIKLNNLISDDSVITDSQLSMKKLSKMLNTSIHATSQVLNESMGATFFEVLAARRIELAGKQLLEQNDIPVSQIAFGVGYNSLSAFNTAFKKKMKVTPTQYRLQHGK